MGADGPGVWENDDALPVFKLGMHDPAQGWTATVHAFDGRTRAIRTTEEDGRVHHFGTSSPSAVASKLSGLAGADPALLTVVQQQMLYGPMAKQSEFFPQENPSFLRRVFRR